MTSPILSTPPSGALAGDATPKPKDAAEAAQQFEALLLTQMLQTVQDESDSSLSGEKDSAQDTMWGMAAQQLSQMLAQRGGIGLAKLITERLVPRALTAPALTGQGSIPAGSSLSSPMP